VCLRCDPTYNVLGTLYGILNARGKRLDCNARSQTGKRKQLWILLYEGFVIKTRDIKKVSHRHLARERNSKQIVSSKTLRPRRSFRVRPVLPSSVCLIDWGSLALSSTIRRAFFKTNPVNVVGRSCYGKNFQIRHFSSVEAVNEFADFLLFTKDTLRSCVWSNEYRFRLEKPVGSRRRP